MPTTDNPLYYDPTMYAIAPAQDLAVPTGRIHVDVQGWTDQALSCVFTALDKLDVRQWFMANVTPTATYPLLDPLTRHQLMEGVIGHLQFQGLRGIQVEGFYLPGEAYVPEVTGKGCPEGGQYRIRVASNMNLHGRRWRPVYLQNTGKIVWIPRSK